MNGIDDAAKKVDAFEKVAEKANNMKLSFLCVFLLISCCGSVFYFSIIRSDKIYDRVNDNNQMLKTKESAELILEKNKLNTFCNKFKMMSDDLLNGNKLMLREIKKVFDYDEVFNDKYVRPPRDKVIKLNQGISSLCQRNI